MPERLMPSIIPRRSIALCSLLLDFGDRFGIAGLLASESMSAVRIAQLHPARLRSSEGILIALADKPASTSATAAICVSRKRPIGPGGTLGRSQKTKSTPLATSDRRRSTLRVRRSAHADSHERTRIA